LKTILFFCSSLKYSAILLVGFFALTLAGTLLQVTHGLWFVQQTIFYAWVIQIPLFQSLFIPFPGMLLLGVLAFINVLSSLLVRLKPTFQNIGLYCIHIGILAFLAGALLSNGVSQHSFISLAPNQSSNRSLSYTHWQVSLYFASASKDPMHFPLHTLSENQSLPAPPYQLTVQQKYTNHLLLQDGTPIPAHTKSEPSTWQPAIFLSSAQMQKPITLTPNHPFILASGDTLVLERMFFTLPFTLTMVQFQKQLYPGSTMPQNYASELVIQEQNRPITIRMNQPFRHYPYSIYQSAYSQHGQTGEYSSVLAVVHNPLRLWPYIASGLLSLGLVVQLLLKLFSQYSYKKSFTSSVFLLLLVVPILPALTQAAPLHNNVQELDDFFAMPILANGRLKPIDTHARQIITQIQGNTRNYRSLFANLLFTPSAAQSSPVFLIESPQLRDALQLKGKDRDRYSYNDIKPHIHSLLAFTNAQNTNHFEQDVTRLLQAWHAYNSLQNALGLFHPASVQHNQLSPADWLQLFSPYEHPPSQPTSFFDFSQESAFFGPFLDSLVSQKSHTDLQKDFLLWLEQSLQFAEVWSRAQFAVLPISVNDRANTIEWLNLGEHLYTKGTLQPSALLFFKAWHNLYLSYHSQNPSAIQQSVHGLHQLYALHTPHNARKLRAEYSYNQLSPFSKASILYGIYILISSVLLLVRRNSLSKFTPVLLYAALLLQILGILLRMYISGRPPITNLYESLIFVSTFGVMSILYWSLKKHWEPGLFFAAVFGFVFLLFSQKFGSQGDSIPVLLPVLNSNFWLASHVITISIGYSAILASGFIAHACLWQKAHLRPIQTTLHITHILQLAGLSFTVIGTVLGGVWADQSWGRFWGWDPKENGALLLILASVFILHGRQAKLFATNGFCIGAIVNILVVLFAWFGINFLGVGLHSYGFSQGSFFGFFVFMGIEVIFLLYIFFTLQKAKQAI
jgi:ABC-type transport system involved in cytochrome c biogenesis permease subunit